MTSPPSHAATELHPPEQPSEPLRGTSSSGGALALGAWQVAVPLIALALAAAFLITASDLTGREGAYPRVLAVVVAVLALVSLVRDTADARRARARLDPDPVTPDAGSAVEAEAALEGGRGAGLSTARVLAFIAVSGVSVYLMGVLGFFAPAILLLGGGLIVLGVRSPWRVAAYTAGLVTAAYLLFVEALLVPFPPAPWS